MLDSKSDLEGLVDVPRLQAWLDDALPELGEGPLQVQMLQGGTSNIILLLSRGGRSVVLRRPPVNATPGGQKTIQREATALKALSTTDVPHPRLFASCSDPEVIGANFYIMERVDGWAGRLAEADTVCAPPFDAAPYKYGLPFALMDALARLANVDFRAVGLDGFGKPEGFLERQVDRWRGQLASYKELYNYPGRDLPGLEYVTDWLKANRPPASPPAIMHGDIGLPNVIFASGPPATVRALIDWELCTIADPLMDLAGFAHCLRDEREPDRLPTHATVKAADFPTRQEIARYYAAGTGRDISHLDYYVVLTMFKSACINEYKVAQAAIGLLPEDVGRFFGRAVTNRIAEAERIARRSGL